MALTRESGASTNVDHVIDGSYVEWGAVTAGAVAGFALSFVLLTFGAAVGLSAVSPWTSTSTTVTAVAVSSAFWILLVSLWSFALGGYMAARLRHPWHGATPDEVEFRDKSHGLLSWALAVVLSAVVAASGATSSGRGLGDGNSARSTASTTAVDALVRTPRTDVPAATDVQRAEVGRILTANLGRGDIEAADRQFLVTLVSNRTGGSASDADRTVADAFTKFKDQVNRARKAGVVMAFLAAASLMVGAAVAWWAAGMGGEHRDKGSVWKGLRRHHHIAVTRNIP